MVSTVGGIVAAVATAAGFAGGIVLTQASRNAAFSFGYLCRNVTTTTCKSYLDDVISSYALGSVFLPLLLPVAAMPLGIYLADKIFRPKPNELSEFTPLLSRKTRSEQTQHQNNNNIV